MLLTNLLLPLTFALPALAEWDVAYTTWVSAKDDAQLKSMSEAYDSAVSAYFATLTTGAAYSKATSEIAEWQQTRKGLPSAVTATGTTTTFNTIPDFVKDLPSDAAALISDVWNKENQIVASITKAAGKANTAGRQVDAGLYMSGAVVAIFGVVVAVL